jgi:hypothetical protein
MQRIIHFWKSGIMGKLVIGCGGLIGLLFICVICGVLFGQEPSREAARTPTPAAIAKVAERPPEGQLFLGNKLNETYYFSRKLLEKGCRLDVERATELKLGETLTHEGDAITITSFSVREIPAKATVTVAYGQVEEFDKVWVGTVKVEISFSTRNRSPKFTATLVDENENEYSLSNITRKLISQGDGWRLEEVTILAYSPKRPAYLLIYHYKPAIIEVSALIYLPCEKAIPFIPYNRWSLIGYVKV